MARNSLCLTAMELNAVTYCCGIADGAFPRIEAIRIEARDPILQLWQAPIPNRI